MHQTQITRGAAAGHTAWARRAAGHRLVLAALAAGQLSESYGRALCQWTGRLPEECREAAEEILLAAAGAGMGLRDLAELAGEIYERSRPDQPDEDPARGFDDRAIRLETTFGGAGVLHGDLAPGPAGVTIPAGSGPRDGECIAARAGRHPAGPAYGGNDDRTGYSSAGASCLGPAASDRSRTARAKASARSR
jgi:hypothetical protein